jgi:alkylation response protein AidB-like acyl-CoA dehydrogenase
MLLFVDQVRLMTNEGAVSKAQEIAGRLLAPSAGQNDKMGRISSEAVESLGESGLLGLMIPMDVGGAGLSTATQQA